MELLKIKYSLLFHGGSSETSHKWIHMRILSFFASDWKKQQKVFSLKVCTSAALRDDEQKAGWWHSAGISPPF